MTGHRTHPRGPAGAAGVLVAVLLAPLLSGCAQSAPHRGAPKAAFPARVLPPTLDGFTTAAEPAAQEALIKSGPTSMVARGVEMTLRQAGSVQGALQLSQLKDGLSTKEDRVRRGIRDSIENHSYRWFKVLDRQWVGVQDLGELRLYLWFPPRSDLFAILQTRSTVDNPEGLVADVIRYQEQT